ELAATGKPFTEQDVVQRACNTGMAASGFGTGGKYQQAIQAATAAVQGLAGGNLSAALAGGAAPYLAEVVKTLTTDPVTGEVNKAANVAAHAVVNAALAVAQGKNALAGAAGAGTGEIVGMIATEMYNKPVSELSETEKQTVSTLATVAAGLAGGLVGESGASAITGAQSGRTTVENNTLGKDKIYDINPMLKIGIEDADGDIQGNGMSKASIPKVPPKLQPFTNPPQGPVIPQGWVSKPGRTPGSTIYYPPNTDPGSPGSSYIRVMPPGSTPVPGLENGYWISVKNGQPTNPATGGTGTRGETHVPLPTDTMPPKR
ncbi:TPA: VENN motif pre-toxin domain-containing protein, partial [Salmonella enterica]